MKTLCLSGLVIGSALASVCGCAHETSDSAAKIQFFVAASASDAAREIQASFQEATGVLCELTLGSSSTLGNQIIQGAPADIFLSANSQWCDEVVRQCEHVVGAPVVLLSNRLVLVVHRESDETFSSTLDCLVEQKHRVAVAATETVPAGIYAKQALKSLGIWEQVKPQLIPANNVRAALQYVETRSLPLGIVYATDAAASPNVRVLYEFDPGLHDKIEYPVVRLDNLGRPASNALFDFLQGDGAAAIFRKHGFSLVSASKSP